MNLPTNKNERAALLDWAKKELARKNIIEFARYINPNYQASAAHIKLAAALEKVERGECNRLIVNFPRRHGKSLLVSQIFPCWLFGRNPRLKIAQCGYAESLTTLHSRQARDLLIGRKYHELFPHIQHRPNSEGQRHILAPMQTAHEWGTQQGGSYYAVGVGGGLAGRGYSIGIIDDPLRGRAEASSKLQRDRVWDWFRGVFYPAQDSDKIRKNAAIIIVMTRWHQDDLAARVQQIDEDEKSEHWDVLSLPAINEKGEALWPERWSIEKLNQIKHVIGSQEFSAQYQQTPKAMEGTALDSTKLKMINAEDLPEMVATVRRWDLAFSDKDGADFTAGVKMGRSADGRYFILHVKRIKGRWTQASPMIVAIADSDGADCACLIEANGTQLGYADEMKQRIPNRIVEPDKPEGNKEMRAAMWGTRLADGIIYCVRADWNQELFDEMDVFPNGTHDDMVDGVSGAWKRLNETGATATIVDHRPQHERIESMKYDRSRTMM